MTDMFMILFSQSTFHIHFHCTENVSCKSIIWSRG